MLFKQDILEKIASGEVNVAFRKWRKPTVKEAGTLLTPVGQLYIERVVPVEPKALSTDDAREAGYENLDQLLRALEHPEAGEYYKIQFHLLGADPRRALREQNSLTPEELAELQVQINRWDARSKHGPWVRQTMSFMEEHPARRAGDLAASLGVEKAWLKANIRKLKQLGLTISLEVGYRLSPRGMAFWQYLKEENDEC